MSEDTTTTTDTTDQDGETTADTDAGTTDAGTTDAKDGTGKDAKPYTPPTEAEWKAAQEKLKKANGQAAAHRKEADELKRKGETADEAAVRTARDEATQAAESTWKPRYVRQAARTALAEAGLTGKPGPLLRLIDVDQVDVDDDGDVSGLDEQIRDLKKEYPAMFAKRGSGAIDGADRGGDTSTATKGGLSATSRKLLDQARS